MNQTADIFTKPLCFDRFRYLCSELTLTVSLCSLRGDIITKEYGHQNILEAAESPTDGEPVLVS